MKRPAIFFVCLLAIAPSAWAQAPTPDPLDEIINRPPATPRPTATPTPEPVVAPTPAPTPKSATQLRWEKLADERSKTRKLPGFLDLRFGEPRATVERKLAKRFKRSGTFDAGVPIFVGTFAGYRNTYIYTAYRNGKLIEASATIQSQDGSNAVDIFDTLTTSLNHKYGLAEFFGAYKDAPLKANPDQAPEDLGFDEAATKEVLNGRAWLSSAYDFSDGNVIAIWSEHFERGVYLRLAYRHASAKQAASKQSRDF